MKPAAFTYSAPETEDEVLALLREFGLDARLLAGGQSLMPLVNMRLVRPAVLIDLNRVRTLDYVMPDSGGLRVGAMTRQRTCERSEIVAERLPLLREALGWVGHPQIRRRGTIGGSLAHADPAAEIPAVAAALGAMCVVVGPAGDRVVAAEEFFVSYLTTALEPTELLREVRFPPMAAHTGCAFCEVSRRHGDFAIVGVAAAVTLDREARIGQARIALTGVSATPARSLEAEAFLAGRRPDDGTLGELPRLVSSRLSPETDLHATAAYRRHAAGILAVRAVRTAVRRAEESRA